jgi:hypothetical protein
MTAEEIAEAEERQRVLMQAFPSARNDVLPVTVDDGPPVVRGVPPMMVGTKSRSINAAYAREEDETPEEQRERVAAQYAQQLAESGGAPADPSVGAPPGALVDPRALALQINPLEELEYARNVKLPDHTEAGQRMQDEQGNFLGLKKQDGFSREAQIARAGELYGQAASGFEAPGRNWEEEFLRGRQEWDDRMGVRSVLAGLSGGAEGVRNFRASELKNRQDYESSLRAAQERDAGRNSPRVSRGLAEAIAGAGLASPEAAVELRMNDPLVKAFTSGGYSQGLRAEGQQIGLQKNTQDNATKIEVADQNNRANLERMVVGKALGIQAAMANKAGSLDNSLEDAEKIDLAVARLQRRVGITREQAVAAFGGSYEGLTPEQQRQAELAVPELKRWANDAAAVRQSIVDQDKVEGGAEAREENAVSKSIALAKNNPKYALEWQTDWESTAIPLKGAIAAWRDMTPQSKKAFVQWSSEGFAGAIQDYLTSPQDQANAGAVRALIDSYIKGLGGSAVTGNEWIRIAKEIGISNAPWSPFKSTAGLEGFLDRSAQLLTSHRKQYEGIMGGWKSGQRATE